MSYIDLSQSVIDLDADDDVVLVPNTQPVTANQRPGSSNRNTRTAVSSHRHRPTDESSQQRPNCECRALIDFMSQQIADLTIQSSEPAAEFSCAICLESPFRNRPTATACGHVFCNRCILRAYQQNKRCPVCKKLISDKQFKLLYI